MDFTKEELYAMKQAFSMLSMTEGNDSFTPNKAGNKTFFVVTDDKKVLEDLASKGILTKQQLAAITNAMPLGKEGRVDQSPQVYIIQLEGKDASHLKGVRAFEATVKPDTHAYANVGIKRTLNITGEAPDKAIPQDSDISTQIWRRNWKLAPEKASDFLMSVNREKFAAVVPDTTLKYVYATVNLESEFGHGLSGMPSKSPLTTDRFKPLGGPT